MELLFEIASSRIHLRSLNPHTDDLSDYLSWLKDVNSNKFILGTDPNYSLDDLVNYILGKNNSNDGLLLGIFVDFSLLIGTVKLEPISSVEKKAWLGIMIGNPRYRGKGFGREALIAIANYARGSLSINELLLGVDPLNYPARSLYLAVGFREIENNGNQIVMVLDCMNIAPVTKELRE